MSIRIRDISISQFRYLGQGVENSRKSLRLKHLPTGMVVDSESEATKELNYRKAFYELMEKLDDQR